MLVAVELPDDPNEPATLDDEIVYCLVEILYPIRFTEEQIGLGHGEDSGHVYDWCVAAFGPGALEYPRDADGDVTFGKPTLVRARPWVMYLGAVYCADMATAAAFKLRWGAEKTETP